MTDAQKERVRRIIATIAGFLALIGALIGLSGAVAFWPQWGGTFLAVATVGVGLGVISLFLMDSWLRDRAFMILTLASAPVTLALFNATANALEETHSAAEKAGLALSAIILLFVVLVCWVGVMLTLRGTVIFGRSATAAFEGTNATEEEKKDRHPGYLLADAVVYAVAAYIFVSLLPFSISGEDGNLTFAGAVNAGIAMLVAASIGKRAFDSLFNSVVAVFCGSGFVSLIAAFVALNYLPDLSQKALSLMTMQFVFGGACTAVSVAFLGVTLKRWLSPPAPKPVPADDEEEAGANESGSETVGDQSDVIATDEPGDAGPEVAK